MTYEIQLNSGKIIKVEAEGFDTKEFAKSLNDNSTTFIGIADVVINKHIISAIYPEVTESLS